MKSGPRSSRRRNSAAREGERQRAGREVRRDPSKAVREGLQDTEGHPGMPVLFEPEAEADLLRNLEVQVLRIHDSRRGLRPYPAEVSVSQSSRSSLRSRSGPTGRRPPRSRSRYRRQSSRAEGVKSGSTVKSPERLRKGRGRSSKSSEVSLKPRKAISSPRGRRPET
jgi:hypothetical protein